MVLCSTSASAISPALVFFVLAVACFAPGVAWQHQVGTRRQHGALPSWPTFPWPGQYHQEDAARTEGRIIPKELEKEVDEEVSERVRKSIRSEIEREVKKELEDELKHDADVQESVRRIVRESGDNSTGPQEEQLSNRGKELLRKREDMKAFWWILALLCGLSFLAVGAILLALQRESDTKEDTEEISSSADCQMGLKKFLFRQSNVLILLTPVGILCHFLWRDHVVVMFLLSFMMLVGLALLAESVLEDISLRYPARYMPLLMASVTAWLELTMIVQSLFLGTNALTKGSLIGFVLHNVLFSIGLAFLVGAPRRGSADVGRNELNRVMAHLQLLFLFALVLVTVNQFSSATGMSGEAELSLSSLVAAVMLALFVCLLVFVFVSDTEHLTGGGDTIASLLAQSGRKPMLTYGGAISLLALVALGVYVASGFMVNSIDAASKEVGLPQTFVSAILVPFTTGTAELVVTLVLVRKGAQALPFAVELLLTSATLTTYVVIPATVLMAAVLPGEAISMNFKTVYADAIGGSILFAYVLFAGQHWDWWRGILLIALYIFIALLFFFAPDKAVLTKADDLSAAA